MTSLIDKANEPLEPDVSAKLSDIRDNSKHGKMGVLSLTLTVLAFSAPIAVVTGFVPLTISFGGRGTPVAYAAGILMVMIFAVGYMAMARNMPRPGSFYVFISNGLGKPLGLGSAYLAIFSYLLLLCGSYAFIGVCLNELLAGFSDTHVPWWAWALAAWLIVTAFGYFHLEVSAKALGIAMIIEVFIIMTFNISVIIQDGITNLPTDALSLSVFSEGNIPVAILFSILVFLGFEATALYREEVSNPTKTIPRATYTSVIAIGFFYGLTCYMLICAYGDSAVDVATKDPSTMFSHAIHRYLGPTFTQIKNFSVALSLIAALISIHNVLTRYVLNMSVDGTLPRFLSKIHPKHHSPYRSSFAVSVLAAIFLVMVALKPDIDPVMFYGLSGGLGAVGIIFLMALVSLGIIAWFWRIRDQKLENIWKTCILPIISAASFIATVIYSIANFEVVTGGDKGENLVWLAVLGGVFASGIIFAVYLRLEKNHTYQRIANSETIFNHT